MVDYQVNDALAVKELHRKSLEMADLWETQPGLHGQTAGFELLKTIRRIAPSTTATNGKSPTIDTTVAPTGRSAV